MIPVLLLICSLHRILSFTNLDKRATEFDFSDTIQKLRDSSQTVASSPEGGIDSVAFVEADAAAQSHQPYDLWQDKQQVSLVF